MEPKAMSTSLYGRILNPVQNFERAIDRLVRSDAGQATRKSHVGHIDVHIYMLFFGELKIPP
jgi:hypothetical protein